MTTSLGRISQFIQDIVDAAVIDAYSCVKQEGANMITAVCNATQPVVALNTVNHRAVRNFMAMEFGLLEDGHVESTLMDCIGVLQRRCARCRRDDAEYDDIMNLIMYYAPLLYLYRMLCVIRDVEVIRVVGHTELQVGWQVAINIMRMTAQFPVVATVLNAAAQPGANVSIAFLQSATTVTINGAASNELYISMNTIHLLDTSLTATLSLLVELLQ